MAMRILRPNLSAQLVSVATEAVGSVRGGIPREIRGRGTEAGRIRLAPFMSSKWPASTRNAAASSGGQAEVICKRVL